MGKLVELTWNCSYCGTKKILGRYRECPNCGKPRGKGTRYDLPSNITYVDEETANKINRNPDWLCSYCNTLNSDDLSSCKSCGASKESSEMNYFEMKRKEEEKSLEKQEQELSHYDIDTKDSTYNTQKPKHSDLGYDIHKFSFSNLTPFLTAFGIIGGLVGLIILLMSLFMPKEKIVTITDMSWQRVINVEEERTVEENDWYVPPGGRLLYTREEIKEYDSVIDHYDTVTETKSREVPCGGHEEVTGYRDLGNGYAEEITTWVTDYTTEYYEETREVPVYIQVPIYDTKYYYEIDKWIYNRNVVTKGNDKSPYWGEVTYEENEREQSRLDSYRIECTDKESEETYEKDLGYKEWNNLEIGDTLKIKVNNLSIISELEKLD